MAKINFQISSRATILLGRENIAKAEGAIIELIKNTYDADASLCYILFDTNNDCLYIIDNGTGMSEDTIKNYWMVIGTENKRTKYISHKKRIKSGEKGIGRFALDRLGSVCELFTKTNDINKVLYWKANWTDFEKTNQLLTDVEADLNYINNSFYSNLPSCIQKNLTIINQKISKIIPQHLPVDFSIGTIIKISNLRDKWDSNKLNNLENNLNYLIPPIAENDEYSIVLQTSPLSTPILVQNNIQDDFDYKILSIFNGETFEITIFRNEFDLNRMPAKLFDEPLFQKFPFRKQDLEKGFFKKIYSINELLNITDKKNTNIIEKVKMIGPFKFEYYFMKQSATASHSEKFFYKNISSYRKNWLKNNYGIKLYRDNFLIRPYGEPNSDFSDWLNLNSRNAIDPTGIGDKRRNWKVLNNQSNGIVYISRIKNKVIADKSSREGIIDNEYYALFKNILISIINKFESDRAELCYEFKKYFDKTNEYEKAKIDADALIKKYKNSKKEKAFNTTQNILENDNNILVKALSARKQETEELLSELKLMRSLSTNGLITSSIVHDLRSLSAKLSTRSEQFEEFIDNKAFLLELIEALKNDDKFLLSWLSVITAQLKKDKRTRKLLNIYLAISNSLALISPILKQKNVELKLTTNDSNFKSKVFQTDIDAVLYNLIINSCEAFERDGITLKKIFINLEYKNNNYIIHYSDSGNGISEIFENKYDIFKFSTTSKVDMNGNKIGLGLGMHIVSTTIEEYNGQYILPKDTISKGFKLDIIIPIIGSENNEK